MNIITSSLEAVQPVVDTVLPPLQFVGSRVALGACVFAGISIAFNAFEIANLVSQTVKFLFDKMTGSEENQEYNFKGRVCQITQDVITSGIAGGLMLGIFVAVMNIGANILSSVA